ncbi:g902 [Coccomyxa elongata]
MAYNVKESPTALHGSSYASGRAYFADVASFNSALSLPYATSFTGRTSELTNDAGYVLSGTNLSLTCQSLTVTRTASVSGTLTAASASIAGTITAASASIAGTITAASAVIAGTITISAILPSSSLTGILIGNGFFGGNTQQSYTTVNTPGNVTYTPSQLIGGFMLRSAGTNGAYTDTLPSGAALFTACNSIVGATFTFTMYPLYSITIAAGSGGGIYGGFLGNSGGFTAYTAYSAAQGNTSMLLPNGATYVLFFVITSATSYTVFIK